jgi:hypothetical protein
LNIEGHGATVRRHHTSGHEQCPSKLRGGALRLAGALIGCAAAGCQRNEHGKKGMGRTMQGAMT